MISGASHYVQVSPSAYRTIWLGMALLHGLSVVFFGAVSWFYHVTPGTDLGRFLDFFIVGLPSSHYQLLSMFHGAIASLHSVLLLCMVMWSMYTRSFSFGPLHPSTRSESKDAKQSSFPRLSQWASHVWIPASRVFGRTGWFGVEGRFFDLNLIVREVIATAMQSINAYNMSQRVPRLTLNRSYVALLVVNCVLTPILHTVYRDRPLLRRVVLLVCDAVLDLFSAVIIPAGLILAYASDYDQAKGGFTAALWYDDVWYVMATNEFLLILVSSWGDFAGRIIFSLGLINAMENVKLLVRAPDARLTGPRIAVVPAAVAVLSAATDSKQLSRIAADLAGKIRHQSRFERLANLCFGLWGIAIMVFHLHAGLIERLPQCTKQVRPWFSTKPSCTLLLVNCYDQELTGSSTELSHSWSQPDEASVRFLVLRHCSHVEVSPVIQRFSSLYKIKLYNSTVVGWPSEAALTARAHTMLAGASFVRVNFSGGQLPPGLYDPAFPPQLVSIFFCVTNLRQLPNDLDTKWPKRLSLLIEHAQFESVPDAIVRLQPSQLSLARNRLTKFPFAVLSIVGLRYANFGRNPFTSLVVDQTLPNDYDSNSLMKVSLSNANVSVLPSWMDRMLRVRLASGPMSRIPVELHGSPFCDEAQRLLDGKIDGFTVPPSMDSSRLSFVMQLGASNASIVRDLGLCVPGFDVFYPLATEDYTSRLVV